MLYDKKVKGDPQIVALPELSRDMIDSRREKET